MDVGPQQHRADRQRQRRASRDADIDAPEAWNATTGSSSVTVAVVDTGVAYDNPDLSPNIWTNPGETGSGKETNGIDDDGDTLIDDWHGWDYVDNDNDPRDFHGHGTHVAGTIGAKGNNGQGVAGVNWNVGLMPLRVLGADGAGTSADARLRVRLRRRSGSRGRQRQSRRLRASSQAVFDAIDGAPNTLFVVAAGNDRQRRRRGHAALPVQLHVGQPDLRRGEHAVRRARELLQLRHDVGRPGGAGHQHPQHDAGLQDAVQSTKTSRARSPHLDHRWHQQQLGATRTSWPSAAASA